MKSKRQSAILEIIENYDIETQEELIDSLRREGFNVTQATISRDIRELKLTKVTGENGNYKYVLPGTKPTSSGQHIYSNTVANSILSVEYAMNLIVVKTYPGMAQAVAAGVDSMHEADILGCVAGDDCIIIVTRDTESAVEIASRIRKLMNS